jgi:hypothetical protein
MAAVLVGLCQFLFGLRSALGRCQHDDSPFQPETVLADGRRRSLVNIAHIAPESRVALAPRCDRIAGLDSASGALRRMSPLVLLSAMEMTMASSKRQARDQVSARLDADILKVVQTVAEAERRPISNLLRNIVSDWAMARRQAEQQQPRAA